MLGRCFCTLASYLSPDDDPQWSVILDQVGNMSFVMIQYSKRKEWSARLYSRKDFYSFFFESLLFMSGVVTEEKWVG